MLLPQKGENMKKLSFQTQIKISLGIYLLCFVIAHITKQGVFTNVGWITRFYP